MKSGIHSQQNLDCLTEHLSSEEKPIKWQRVWDKLTARSTLILERHEPPYNIMLNTVSVPESQCERYGFLTQSMTEIERHTDGQTELLKHTLFLWECLNSRCRSRQLTVLFSFRLCCDGISLASFVK